MKMLLRKHFPLYMIYILLQCKGSFQCNNGWTAFENSCYHVADEMLNMVNAMNMCKFHQSTLIKIESRAEQHFLDSTLLLNLKGDEYWTAGSDWTVENKWVWEPDGNPFGYLNWDQGQPNDYHGTEDCMTLHRNTGSHHNQHSSSHHGNGAPFVWRDWDCSTQYQYICELNLTALVTKSPLTTAEPNIIG